MPITVRAYESDTSAEQASALLTETGFRSDLIYRFSGTSGNPEQIVSSAVEADQLPREYTAVATKLLAEGKTILAIRPPFGNTLLAEELMDKCHPIQDIQFPTIHFADPSPLSDFLGIPTLSHGYTFGEPGLSKSPSPLSSMFGLKLLSAGKANKTSSFGIPLLSRPKPDRTSSFGLPLLSKPKPDRTTSFGFPLLTKRKPGPGSTKLSHNPTPLSSMFGLPVLTKSSSTRDSDED